MSVRLSEVRIRQPEVVSATRTRAVLQSINKGISIYLLQCRFDRRGHIRTSLRWGLGAICCTDTTLPGGTLHVLQSITPLHGALLVASWEACRIAAVTQPEVASHVLPGHIPHSLSVREMLTLDACVCCPSDRR